MRNKAAKRQASEQAKLANLLQKQMLQQFSESRETLAFLQREIDRLIKEPGFTDATRAALRTGILEASQARFGAAERALQARSFVSGGRQIPSGADIAALEALAGERAAFEAGALRDLAVTEEELRRQREQFALNLAAGPLLGGILATPGLVLPTLEARRQAFESAKATGGSFLGKFLGALGGFALAPLTGGASLSGPLGAIFGGTRLGGILGGLGLGGAGTALDAIPLRRPTAAAIQPLSGLP